MFEKGDEVICIKNTDNSKKDYDIEIGCTYIVSDFHKGIDSIDYDYIVVEGSQFVWETYNFISLIEYRKLKIDKIRERCLKKVIN